MADRYGSDFINVVDDAGVEYEFEVLSTLDYNGMTYLAAIPVGEAMDHEVIIFREIEEDGEPILCIVDDEIEMQTVDNLIMESLFEEFEEP